MRQLAIAAVLGLMATSSLGAVRAEPVVYRHGDAVLKGYLAYDEALGEKRPGILLVHEWWGLNDYARRRVKDLAALGYVVLGADIYGEGKVTEEAQEAGHLAGVFLKDRALLRDRAQAALSVLQTHDRVDIERLAAIGYCFGGTTVLELARANAKVQGVVSFHGGLKAAETPASQRITPRVLVLHGADDPFIPAADISAFQEEMRTASADWQMVLLGGAQHSFTNPEAKGSLKGALYDKLADRRSWAYMKQFFAEIFE